jgi:hypothetical protein
MVLMASGRCDIVAFHTPWFLNRLKEGYVMTRNPFNKKLVSQINFSDVDLILFCTKNPLPIIDHLNSIKKPILFHVTLTPYKNDIEVNVIDKNKIIDGIKRISKILGKENIIVRYDPIFVSDKYTIDYHKKAFERLCIMLDGYIEKFIVSFIDDYKNVRKNYNILRYKELSEEDYKEIGTFFSSVAKEYGMTVQTCAEKRNLVEYGFIEGECISHELAYILTGKKFKSQKIRPNVNCRCVETVDIGEYNTCSHLCKYCYANFDEDKIKENRKLHDVNSPLLIGHLEDDDIIKIRC